MMEEKKNQPFNAALKGHNFPPPLNKITIYEIISTKEIELTSEDTCYVKTGVILSWYLLEDSRLVCGEDLPDDVDIVGGSLLEDIEGEYVDFFLKSSDKNTIIIPKGSVLAKIVVDRREEKDGEKISGIRIGKIK